MNDSNKILFRQFVWYMLIFSIIGLILETAYCFITTGVLESRKGLILGPVCPIYGVGAVVIIAGLNRYKGNKWKLFLMGILLGSLAEYIISFGLESLYGSRFWEYSYMKYHLNGRISILYSLFWGILSVLVIQIVKPLIDKYIVKIKYFWINVLILVILVFDALITIWGVNVYIERVEFGRRKPEKSSYFESAKYDFEEICFSNKIMSATFPNMRIIDRNGDEIWIKDLINK
jgi:uncharacterized membrane protein